jgi:hypothetical protein
LNRYLSRKNELPNGSPAVAGERAA